MADLKFYKCLACGNVVVKIHDSGVPLICCGSAMQLLEPNTVDAASEKHLPQVEVDGDTATVRVGELAHPMDQEHYISYIALETDRAILSCRLKAGAEPKAVFALDGAKVLAAYEYCTKHGLWKTQL